MEISRSLFHEIISTFAYEELEKGGLVFLRGNEIVSFFLDKSGSGTERAYRPNIRALRAAIRAEAEKGRGDFAFLHSHPVSEPISGADVAYIRRFVQLNGLDAFHLFLAFRDRLCCYRIAPADVTSVPVRVIEETD